MILSIRPRFRRRDLALPPEPGVPWRGEKGGCRLLTVHGSYVPAGTEGFFFLFGLDPAAETGRVRALQQHPQAVEPERLYPLLRGLPHLHGLTCVVTLPAGRLVPFKVPGLALSVGDAAQWLLDLEERFNRQPMRPGRSLTAWSTAAKLLLELLGRGRILPRLSVEAGCLTAGWQMAAPEAADAERLAMLEAALPELCRAVVPPDRNHRTYRPPSPGALLGRFLQAGAAALTERFLESMPRPFSEAGSQSALRHWLLALAGQAGRDLPAGLIGAPALFAAVDEWIAPASGVRGLQSLKSGLRLNLPAETEQGGWELELVLQTTVEPVVTIPAESVWEAIGQELVIGHHRYQNAEQRLLADLPAMARLYPPLEPLRFASAPAKLQVDGEAVLQLLQEGAPLLQEAGFLVLIPTGLLRTAGLRAKMHLKPMSGQTESRFGLDQIVDVDWELALGPLSVDWDELQRMAREKALLVQSQGYWVQVDQRALQTALKNLEPYRKQIELRTAVKLAARGQAAPGTDGAPADPAQAKAPPLTVEATGEGWVLDVLERLREPAKIEPLPAPRGLRATLRPYQERGFHWLAFMRRYGLGAILADDMGLGKTVQVTALLLHEREQGWTDKPTLLVCPVSLVGNWKRELARFAPSLRVLVHHGSGRAESLAQQALEHDVVITTYALAARDESELAALPWAGLVVDEAQNLKNPAAKHAQALRRMPPGYRIALTGTPVENHLGDLWALFHLINPGMLGSQEEFRKSFALPIERYRDEEAAARLRSLVQPFMLRRLKTDPTIIDDLPEKQENPVYVNLTLEQAALYEAVVEETMNRTLGLSGIARHGAVLAGLTKLKQVCNHPSGLVADGGPMEGRSGKLDRLTEMLEEVLSEGDSALIFTQFSQFGARLREYLARRFGCPVLFLDGSTPRTERERMIQAFQAGEAPLFILSLKAGGVGLNLTRASHVFHFDRWWNPAVEDQATDRAFRIGQTQRVMVHKLVTAGTLEERIDQLLSEKRLLSDQVVATGESWLGELSTEELARLIALEQEG
ncbi:MAG: DEAD/DEAH box helicase [Bacillota bacterium]